jgi:hypothetical protein
MKKLITVLAVAMALAIPTSVAFAKGPPLTRGKSAPKVMYVLKGTFSNFQAATSTADGSISITVSHANRHGKNLTNLLKSDTLTFAVASNTRITFANGTTSLADTAKGMVKFRAPLLRGASEATLAAALPSMAKALHIIVTTAPTT